jgi:predicted HNH restriction endonuclease
VEFSLTTTNKRNKIETTYETIIVVKEEDDKEYRGNILKHHTQYMCHVFYCDFDENFTSS